MKAKYILLAAIAFVSLALFGGYLWTKKVNKNGKKTSASYQNPSKNKEPEAYTLLRKLAVKYKNTKEYYGEIRYEVFDAKKSETVVESFDGICAYNVQNFYIKSIDCENVLNEKHKILVSDDEKTIFLGKRDSLDDGSKYIFNPRNFDSIQLVAIGGLQLEKNSADLYTITYIPRFEDWSKISLSFNPNTFEVKMVLMWVGESYQDADFGNVDDPVVRCIYSKQSFDQPLDPNLFRSDKYFALVGDKIQGVGRFAGYEVELLQ